MSEMAPLLTESLQRLLEQQCAPEQVQAWERGEDRSALWQAVEGMGLPLLLVPEEADGAGGDFEDAAAVMRVCGRFFAPLPLAETLLANRLLAGAGGTLPGGRIGIAVAPTARVAWAGAFDHLLQVKGNEVRLLAADAAAAGAPNLAGEPAGALEEGPAASLEGDTRAEEVFALCALLRAAQLAGAMERVVEMTAGYLGERQQFGRPLNRFQAVQHGLVRAAGEAAAAGTAVDAAAHAASRGHALFEIAVAKARASEAAGVVAALVHQLHGAIGFTRDLPLNLGTRRLWAWREDYGSEVFWQEWIGRRVAARGGDALWQSLTRVT